MSLQIEALCKELCGTFTFKSFFLQSAVQLLLRFHSLTTGSIVQRLGSCQTEVTKQMIKLTRSRSGSHEDNDLASTVRELLKRLAC